MDSEIPSWKENDSQTEEKQHETAKRDCAALCGTWNRTFYYAVHGECAECLFQYKPAEIWRRCGSRSDDDSDQRDAVFDASAAGTVSGSTADHQL